MSRRKKVSLVAPLQCASIFEMCRQAYPTFSRARFSYRSGSLILTPFANESNSIPPGRCIETGLAKKTGKPYSSGLNRNRLGSIESGAK
jgi:hypothetical protein